MDTPQEQRHSGKLLIVDPDRLTRWSVEAYLSGIFDVLTAESLAAALEFLDHQAVEAVVVSDDLPDDGADTVEEQARAGNRCVTVVRTVSEPVRAHLAADPNVLLEKPFKLSVLADILGVPGRVSC